MKNFLLLLWLATNSFSVNSQNVGIGIALPSERLDVNGNVNISGLLKIDGEPGNSGQFLMSRGAGQNPGWADPGLNVTKRFNALSGTQSFSVPAGVTKIMIEGWSAGGYPFTDAGNERYSGGSGGYVKGIIAVTPGTVFTIHVPAAQGAALTADTLKMETATSKLWIISGDSSRGGFLSSRTGAFDDVLNVDGEDGEPLYSTYFQNNSAQTVRELHFPKGGDAPYGGTGGGGQTVLQKTAISDYYFLGKHKRSSFPGGGGYFRFSFTNAPIYSSNAGAPGVLFIYY